MRTELKHYTVEEIAKGFVYNELEGKGLFGLSGKLVIQPEYQRNYLYNDGLALGSFDGPAITAGDFTTLPLLTTPADGLAIVNRGRHNLCVVQFQ